MLEVKHSLAKREGYNTFSFKFRLFRKIFFNYLLTIFSHSFLKNADVISTFQLLLVTTIINMSLR